MDVLAALGIGAENFGACVGPGWWFSAESSKVLLSYNPATQRRLGMVHVATRADYETVVERARAASRRWREVPAPKRGEVVRQIGERLRATKDLLGTLVALETGKIKAEGDGEVQEMIDIAEFAVGQSRMLYGKSMHSERPWHRLYEQWHPLGVVGVITAFNFPMAVWAWNAFIAAVAGNSIIWRPSPKAPLCALAVQYICNEVLEETGHGGIFCLLVEGATELVECLIREPRVPLISFTGSSEVGRHVAEVVAHRLGRSLLELSGNNAVIVDESADLDLAVPAIVFGAVGTAGQRCTSTRRLIAHEKRYDELLSRLISNYRQISIGDPLDPGVLMGPLIDEAAVERFMAATEEVKQQGGELLYGGETITRPGWFVHPTLARAENDWPIVQRETFAPLLHVMSFRTLDQAIALHNGVPQGLSSALFTNDLRHAERFLSSAGSDCGIANINVGTSGAEIGGAFGGEKDSGAGREAGSDAWQAYMRRQTNTINWGSSVPLAQGIHFGLSNG